MSAAISDRTDDHVQTELERRDSRDRESRTCRRAARLVGTEERLARLLAVVERIESLNTRLDALCGELGAQPDER
jgi:hypothetical protein